MNAAALGTITLVNGLATAAQVTVVDGRYDGEKYVSITGAITSGDLDKVKRAARTAIQQGNNRLSLLLNSEGGDIVEAMRIGRWARERLATTYVYGYSLYTPGTPEGLELEQYGRKYSHMKFGLRPIEAGKRSLETEDIVRCYSACVIIFFGGVSRHASDNTDYRSGFKQGQLVPVVGLHRPYFAPTEYSSLSPTEANNRYQQLEKAVRDYLYEMGAPVVLVDRMFRKASNEIEILPSEKFGEFYQAEEPFIQEWLLAKCGAYGPTDALDEQELHDYESYHRSLKQALNRGFIHSTKDIDRFATREISAARIRHLETKIKAANAVVSKCRDAAITKTQVDWAALGH